VEMVELVPLGGMADHELREAYWSLDWFASSEPRLGHCNMAAEAIACGVPVVTQDENSAAFASLVIHTSSLRNFFTQPIQRLGTAPMVQNLIRAFHRYDEHDS